MAAGAAGYLACWLPDAEVGRQQEVPAEAVRFANETWEYESGGATGGDEECLGRWRAHNTHTPTEIALVE